MTSTDRVRRWRLAHPKAARAAYRRSYARNREIISARNKAKQLAHQERSAAIQRRYYLRNREAVLARVKTRRLADPEKSRAAVRKCHKKHAKARNAYTKVYAKAHPEAMRVIRRNSYMRRRGVPGQHRPHQIRLIYESQSGLYYYCVTPLLGVFQVDHMVPVARGGTNWPSNLCCACGACNQAKRTMTAEEFLAARAA